jgi:flagellar biosynthetic protein FliQ
MTGALVRDGMAALAVAGGPLFAGLFAVGLVMGIVQASTQINDPAVGFVPRALAAVALCAALGSWMVERLAAFLIHSLNQMGPGL